MKSVILSEREARRFAEQMKLPSVGLKGQEKLKKAKVLVIGSGGKGTALLQNLTAAGIGTIGISDNFTVEEAFLPRQSLYGDQDIGKQKAIISKQKLARISEMVHIKLHNICLSEENILQIMKDYDLIADATDNFAAHYLINDAAIMLDKAVVFGTVFHRQGMITVFNHEEGPSFRCLFPKIPHNTQDTKDEGIYGLSVLYQITGALMANEVFAVLLGHPVVLSGRMLIFDIADYTFRTKIIAKNPENFKKTGFVK